MHATKSRAQVRHRITSGDQQTPTGVHIVGAPRKIDIGVAAEVMPTLNGGQTWVLGLQERTGTAFKLCRLDSLFAQRAAHACHEVHEQSCYAQFMPNRYPTR